ncbi:MAG: integrase core domain-containing protein [Solirubrobacterales bacterium]
MGSHRRCGHGVLASVGTVGDAYDNAMAESFVDSFKTELIADRIWRSRSKLELAVVSYVSWFNNERLYESLGDISPAEFEDLYVRQGGRLLYEDWIQLKQSPWNLVRLTADVQLRRWSQQGYYRTPMRRSINQDLVQLTGVLSNPSITKRLDSLAAVLALQQPGLSTHRINLPRLPLAQGQILLTIKNVLASHPDGLQAFEIRQLVERELGHKIPRSTVKDALARNPAFDRIARGRYRSTGSDATSSASDQRPHWIRHRPAMCPS